MLAGIEDFEMVGFTKYVPIEDVLYRICNNLNNDIIFQDLPKDKAGEFDSNLGEIHIAKSLKANSEQTATIVFHELLHCITKHEDLEQVGFRGKSEFFDEDEEDIQEGYGLNEGMTKYLENKRNKQKGLSKSQGYPILSSAVENLIYVIGEEKIIDSYFNNPDSLEDILETHNIDAFGIVLSLDSIYHLEKKVIKSNNNEEKLLKAIFQFNVENETYDLIGSYMFDFNREILYGTEEINTIEDFKRLVGLATRLKMQNYGMDENQIYGYILEHVKKLHNQGYDLEEINAILNENGLEQEIETQGKIEEFIGRNKEDLIKSLYMEYEEETDLLDKILWCGSYNKLFTQQLCGDRELKLQDILIIGKLLSQYPEIEFDEVSLTEYNLHASASSGIGTGESEQTVYIFTTIDGRCISIIGDDFCELEQQAGGLTATYKNDDKNIKITQRNELMKFYDGETGEELDTECEKHIESNIDFELEELLKKKKFEEGRREKMIGLNAPKIILQNQEALLQDIIERIEGLNKRKLVKSIKRHQEEANNLEEQLRDKEVER